MSRLAILPTLAAALLCGAALHLPAPEAAAQEWTRFRGPDGTGIGRITSLPAELQPEDIAWTVELDGVGHSCPVLWGEKLFITIAAADGTNRRVQAYDARDGSLLWEWTAPLEEHPQHRFNTFASATPVVTAEALHVVWASGTETQALALNHEGEVLWERSWPHFSSDHGFAASPVMQEGVLIFHTDSLEEKRSYVVGLDPASGETLWEVERVTDDEKHTTAYGTPATTTLDGAPVLVVFQTNDGWRGLSPKTGELVWRYEGGYTQRNVSSIVESDGVVFAVVGSGGAGRQAHALRPASDGSAELLYELGISDGLGYVPTPLIHEGRLYLWGDGGVLACRDFATGEEIYRERIGGGGNFFSSPVIADGKIYCGSRDGELVAVKLGPQFELLGVTTFDSGIHATPAIANNRFYLRTDTQLLCVPGK